MTPEEWLLAVLSVIVATGSYVTRSYAEITGVTFVLLLLNVALVTLAVKQTLHTAIPGRLLFTASITLAFYLEAAVSGLSNPAFHVPFSTSMGFSQFPISLIKAALLSTSCFFLMYLAGYSMELRLPKMNRFLSHQVDRNGNLVDIALYIIVGLSFLFLLATQGFHTGGLVHTLLASRSRERKGQDDLGAIGALSSFALFAAGMLFLRVAVHKKNRLLNLCAGLLSVLPVVLSGTRYRLLYVFLPLLIAGFRRLANARKRRPLLWGSLLLSLFIVFQLQAALRLKGWSRIDEIKLSSLGDLKMTMQFDSLMMTLHLVPDRHPYFLTSIGPEWVTFWVPRALWPTKPTAAAYTYFTNTWTQSDLTFFNVTPSIIGQFHMAWGWFGVLFAGAMMGVLTRVADTLCVSLDLKRQTAIVAALGFYYAFLLSAIRYFGPFYFVHVLAGAMCLLFLTHPKNSTQMRVPAQFRREHETAIAR